MFITTFNQLSKDDVSTAGGKGASLGELIQAGIPVPEGFVILSSAFEKYIDDNNLRADIKSILHSVDHNKVHTVENASEKIKALMLQAEIPKEIENEIIKAFKQLNSKFVAVRSSATAEDSKTAAWAGQLETYLNTTEENLLANIKKCFASLFTPRAIFYRFEKNLHKQDISVAVVIQKMIQSEVSGVAFSVHPVTCDKNQLIIEAAYGLGEAIVSGQITPDSYVVEKQPLKIIDKNISNQTKALVHSLNKGNIWEQIKEKGKQQKLSDDEITKLSKLIIKIENHYGFPVDIEWAYEKKKFYITQSRPITTLQIEKGREMNKIKWEKVLIRQNSIFMDAMKMEGSARVYNDIGIDYTVSDFKIINGINYRPQNVYKKFIDQINIHLIEDDTFLLKIAKKCYRDVKKSRWYWEEIRSVNFKKTTIKKLKSYFTIYLKSLYKLMAYLHLPFAVEIIMTDKVHNMILKRINPKIYPDKYQMVFSLLTVSNKRSSTQQEKIELSEILSSLDTKIVSKKIIISKPLLTHLNKWQWLGDHYFKGEFWNQSVLIDRITELQNFNYQDQLKTILKQEKTEKESYKQTIKELKLSIIERNIAETAKEYGYLRAFRLDVIFESEYLVWPLFEEIAERLKISTNDLLCLTPEEILHCLEGYIPEREKINSRKKNYALVMIAGELKIYVNSKVNQYIEIESIKSTIEIKGNIAYSGIVCGLAKIVISNKDLKNVRKGNVLVASMTTPNYVPAMEKAIAFVTNEGGITCHAAIVAREMKKPCIIGTKIATQVLKDGDLVEVDANQGIVKILKKAD